MPSPNPREGSAVEAWTRVRLFRLTAFWFALSFHWAVLLSMVLQRQVERFAPAELQGTVLGLLAGSGAVAAAVVQLVAGHRSDRTASRFGRRRPYLVAGTLLSLGGLGLMAVAQGLVAVAAAFVLIQLTLNLAIGPYQALLPDLVPRARHGVASAWMGIMRNVGEAAGPLVAGALLGGHVAAIMGVDAVLLVGLMLVTVLGVEEPPAGGDGRSRPGPAQAAPEDRRPEGPPAPAAPGHGAAPSPWDAFRAPLRPYPDFVRLLVSRAIINLGFYTALTFFYFYVQHSLGVPDYREATGKLLFGMVLAGLLGAVPAGALGDRHDKVRLIYGANGLTAVAAVCFVLAPDLRWAALAGLFLGVGFGAFTVLDWALAFALLPPGGSARYMAIWNLATVGPMVIAPLVAGPLTDLLKAELGPAVAYRSALALVVVYLVAGTMALRGLRVPAPEEREA